jgi:hypothetical protein
VFNKYKELYRMCKERNSLILVGRTLRGMAELSVLI